MSTTVQAILTAAFRKCGVLTMNETPTADMSNDALAAMNDMLASWSLEEMSCYARAWETFNLTAGLGGKTTPYTIGVGANFNTARPINIAAAYVTLGGVDYPIDVISDEIYNNQVNVKDLSGIPEWLNLDNSYPVGNIRLFPVPSSAYPLFILSEKPLTSYALGATVDLPPGWERAIIFNLPAEIAGDYGTDVPQSVTTVAVASKAAIQRQVRRMRSFDADPHSITTNNIYTGWYK